MASTRLHFLEELTALQDQLLEMGSEANAMLNEAVRALVEQDEERANQVIARDEIVDEQDLQIEAECMRLIALQQPLARDLRLVGTAFKVITDLERIGDHAVDIAKVARKLARETFYQPLVDIPHMANLVSRMLKEVMAAFVSHDLDAVDAVVAADDQVDLLFHKLRDDLHAVMRRDPTLVVQASYLLFVAHYLERIADHTVNIAERIYYVETGSLSQLSHSHQASS